MFNCCLVFLLEIYVLIWKNFKWFWFMHVHLCLGQESLETLCPSFCSHLGTPSLLGRWLLAHLWRALCIPVQNLDIGVFCHIKKTKPNNLQVALAVRGLCTFLFHPADLWQRQWIFFILHLMQNPARNLWGICTCKMEITNTMDFLWLSSSADFWFMCFFPISSFSCLWCNTGNYFLYLHSRTESLFILFLNVSHHSSHFSKSWTEGWVRASLKPESPGLKCSLPCGLHNKARYCIAQPGETSVIQFVVCQLLLVPDILDRCPKTITSLSFLVVLACSKCASQFGVGM